MRKATTTSVENNRTYRHPWFKHNQETAYSGIGVNVMKQTGKRVNCAVCQLYLKLVEHRVSDKEEITVLEKFNDESMML